jgi:2,3,4,5-tetrahydropyridine-2-carboxylate N-succinyltransferase
VQGEWGKQNGLSISTPLIVKYRDDKTDARTALESALR